MMENIEDKYIGLGLAIFSAMAIGTSFVITKKGLIQAEERHGFEGDGFVYLKNPLWWAGISTLGLGEIFNFAAYAFAPAILVTPLGALSVLIGAVLGSYFLKEELGTLGRLGSAICLIGAVVIVLHAPPDENIETVDEILNYAIQPGFLLYAISVVIFAVFMIYKVAPKHGKDQPMIYISICSTVGSVSVMSVKAFGIALKLTFAGHNQFSHPSTYVFMILTAVCILTQMNYFNKALASFPTNMGFNTANVVNTLSLLCGFLITFAGVYLLNLSRGDPHGQKLAARRVHDDAIGTDMVSSFQTRRSMQARRSGEMGRFSLSSQNGDREGLIRAYDAEEANGFGLTDLAEDSGSESGDRRPNGSAKANGNGKARQETIEMDNR